MSVAASRRSTPCTTPTSPNCTALVPAQLGGAWSSYWYNRTIYESSITEGVNIFRYQERRIRQRSLRLDHLNPQTQEFSLPAGQQLDPEEAPDDGPEALNARKERRKKAGA